MRSRRLTSNRRLSSGSAGALPEYTLDPHPGGHTATHAGFHVVIKQKSGDSAPTPLRQDLVGRAAGHNVRADQGNGKCEYLTPGRVRLIQIPGSSAPFSPARPAGSPARRS
jgi:hypothetical protein